MNLYVTADVINLASGGGKVTYEEANALHSLEESIAWDRGDLDGGTLSPPSGEEPWKWDLRANSFLGGLRFKPPKLAHFYSGTFSTTVAHLKSWGTKVTYTAAAHSIEESKKAHEELGLSYDYPHLTDPELWKKYLQGYLDADVLICPSTHSAQVMKGYGREGRVEVIPHGCVLPKEVKPFPKQFTVGYLGAYGPDKGVRYLLEAWKRLNYRDAKLLLGGRDSQGEWVKSLIHAFGGGNIECVGWLDSVSDFYDNISLYVQPSISEGLGIEVLEAQAHQRPVICSKGAGACDTLPEAWTYEPRNVEKLARKIDTARRVISNQPSGWFSLFREGAEKYTWDKVREKYKFVWKGLLA